jgi:hypothetical protein
MTTTTDALEVDRGDTSVTRLVTDILPDADDLPDGQVRMRVDRLALTANTVTYAEMGDMLGYWDFYPTGDDTWGRVPAMGWADVTASAHPDVEAGGRYYGWFPMVGTVDLTVTPTRHGLRDDGEHRRAHAPVYRTFEDSRSDPLAPTGFVDAVELGDLEDRQALLRGLFLTGFLADAFFEHNDWFGARRAVVLSASSKTAIAFADCASQRGLDALIGVTSPGNVDFVRGLDRYSDVVTYDEIASIAPGPAVAIDMAATARRRSLSWVLGCLAHSMRSGAATTTLPGPPDKGPAGGVLFAPTAMSQLTKVATTRLSFRNDRRRLDFVEAPDWLTSTPPGPEATATTWAEVHAGAVPPNIGRIVSLR